MKLEKVIPRESPPWAPSSHEMAHIYTGRWTMMRLSILLLSLLVVVILEAMACQLRQCDEHSKDS